MNRLIRSSVLAGIAIGIAGFGYLAVGGLAGAVLFSFGLLTVVGYKLKLYTGTPPACHTQERAAETSTVASQAAV